MKLTKLKRVAVLRAGGTPAVQAERFWREPPHGVPWVAIGDMSDGRVVSHTVRHVSAEGIAEKRLPVGHPGTVLFAMYASLGAVAELAVEASWNQALLGIEPMPGVSERRFVRYWLEHLRPSLGALARSNTQDNLNAEQVGNLDFPVLSPEAQRAIANYLDTETSRIDTLITKKRRMIELLEEHDQRRLDDLFHRVRQHGLVRLGYLAEVRSGLTLGGAQAKPPPHVALPYLRVANVKHDRLDLSEIKSVTVDMATARRTALRSGDVLMTEGGDIDKLGRGTVWRAEIDPCLHQNHVYAVRTRASSLLPEFLALLTRTSYARRYFEMTGVRSMNLASTNSSKVADFKVPFPSRNTQSRLVSKYQREWDALERTRAATWKQLYLLNERRQALITAAVTGELAVSGGMA